MPLLTTEYKLIRDISPGNIKTGTVPNNRTWTIMWGHIKLTTTTAPTPRALVMRLEIPGDPVPLARTWSPVTQTANTILRYQLFPSIIGQPGLYAGETVFLPLPSFPVMMENWIFTLYDLNNVDPLDHLEIRAIVVKEERII